MQTSQYVLTTLPLEEIVKKQDLEDFEERLIRKLGLSFSAPTEKKLRSRKELAEKFKVSQVTIWDWTKKGYLTFFKIGGRVYYDEDICDKELKQIRLKRA